MLCDLSEALADVALKLGVWVGDKCSKVGDGTLVNDCLRKLLGVLGNFRESGGRNALEGQLRLLHAKYQKADCTRVNDRLSEVFIVFSDARKRQSCGFLN